MIEFYEVTPASAVGQIKSIRVPQTARKQLVFKLTDGEGRAVDLTHEVENPPAAVPDWSPQKQVAEAYTTVVLLCRSGGLYGPERFRVQGKIIPDKPGFVSFQLETTDTTYNGVYSATIGQFVPGEHLIQTWPVQIIIEPNAFAQTNQTGTLTIPEVRYGLLDVQNGTGGAPFNNLLDDVEFTDAEYMFAMTQVVDRWNETPPPVCPYSTATFPYRYWWLRGTIAHLLIMGAARYRRNRLDYQAGGIAVNDQSKADEYENVGRETLKEFDQWMLREKTRINMEYCWGFGL